MEGEERIQNFFEDMISYGVEQGAFPAGSIHLKAHCLLVLAQSWAVRHWALTSFTKLDDYLEPLKTLAVSILESDAGELPYAQKLLATQKAQNADHVSHPTGTA